MMTLSQSQFLEAISGSTVVAADGAILFSHRSSTITVFAAYRSGGAMILDTISIPTPLAFDEFTERAAEWLFKERAWPRLTG